MMIRHCRTFGELADYRHARHEGLCAFCHEQRESTMRYSTRHSICDSCVIPRRDVVLPAVKKRERFEARMAEIRAEAEKVQP
jgi:hypothetical protein